MRYKNKIIGFILLFLIIGFININNSFKVIASEVENEELTDQLKAGLNTRDENLDPAQQQALEHANKQAGEAGSGLKGYESKPVNLTEMGINPTNIDSVENLGGRIMRFLNLTIFGISLLGVLYGGFTLMTAAGKDDRINLGKDVLKYSIAGMVITLAAYLIVTLVQSILYSLAEF